MTTTPYPGTKTALRAVALLKAFTDAHPTRSLGELARATGLSKATAYRLLTALEHEGLVVRDPDGVGYRLGPALIALGGRALRANDLRRAAHEELERLAEATGETATLEVLDGADVLVLDEVVGGHRVATAPSLGARWPAHATSTGKALLAYLPEARLDDVLKGPLPRYTDRTLADPARLRRALATVRRRGYAVAFGELEEGFVAVGAPVRNHDGEVVAAVSVGGPVHRLPRRRLPALARQVRQAAERVSARLGYDPGGEGRS